MTEEKAIEQLSTEIAMMIYNERVKQDLRQLDIAERLNTHQQVVSLYEKPGYNHTVVTLQKVARALGKRLEIKLI